MIRTTQKRSGWLEALGFLAPALMIAGPLLAWMRRIPGLPGFGLYALGGLLAVAVAA